MESETVIYNTGKIKILHCLRCGYEWPQRYPDQEPKTCANRECKSPYWNKPRRNKTVRGKPVTNITDRNI